MELDGFNEKLQIAFEYNGAQHYREVDIFKYTSLEKRKRLDSEKKSLCELNGVRLITIPEFTKDFKEKNLKDFIIKQCQELNICVPNSDLLVDFSSAYIPDEVSIQEKLEQLVFNKKGKLYTKYTRATGYISCECGICGYKWETMAYLVLNGSWCFQCARKTGPRSWRPEQIQFLQKNYSTAERDYLVTHLGKKWAYIAKKALTLKLKRKWGV